MKEEVLDKNKKENKTKRKHKIDKKKLGTKILAWILAIVMVLGSIIFVIYEVWYYYQYQKALKEYNTQSIESTVNSETKDATPQENTTPEENTETSEN